ncbi:MAG: sugar ABC transporter ATP-binding protein [Tessaracoccus sp.]
MSNDVILEMEGIRKTFPGVVALDNVQLAVRKGTVHSLMGENGAGKSTLMKVLIGMYVPDDGTVRLNGKEVSFTSTRDGLAAGISMIHQELSPVPEMTVAENIWLGREPRGGLGLVDHKLMVRKTQELLDHWGLDINPRAQMKNLTVARQQMVEIAKAISYDAQIIIMDEPTSAIPEREVAHLHTMITRLTDSGVAIVYITHKMDEVFKISDDITIFRDGKYVATKLASELTRDTLIQLMVGRELTDLFPKLEAEIGEVLLSVRNLNRGSLVKDVSFDVRKGEIVGFAGLMGAGRTEVLETIFGITPADSGEIVINGQKLDIRQPKDAIAANIGLLTEDRKLNGILGVLSVGDNMIVAALPRYSPNGFLELGRIRKDCDEQKTAMRVKTPSLNQLIKNLSGGNQQKALIARWLLTVPDILMIDEPTRGIDVGAKSEIHRLMSSLAQQGKAIIMVSSELPEVLGMSDHILVMHEGRISGELSREEANQERVMHYATAAMPPPPHKKGLTP